MAGLNILPSSHNMIVAKPKLNPYSAMVRRSH